MEGEGFRFGGEILEGVHASGAKVAVHGPERGLFGRVVARLDNLVTETVVADDPARRDFKGVEVAYVPHPVRRDGVRGVDRRNVLAHSVLSPWFVVGERIRAGLARRGAGISTRLAKETLSRCGRL